MAAKSGGGLPSFTVHRYVNPCDDYDFFTHHIPESNYLRKRCWVQGWFNGVKYRRSPQNDRHGQTQR
jgi:hypothetical protein